MGTKLYFNLDSLSLSQKLCSLKALQPQGVKKSFAREDVIFSLTIWIKFTHGCYPSQRLKKSHVEENIYNTCKVAGVTDTTTIIKKFKKKNWYHNPTITQQLEGNEMKKEGSLDASEIGYLINVTWVPSSYCMTITSRNIQRDI